MTNDHTTFELPVSALPTAGPDRTLNWLARGLLVLLGVSALALRFTPWQQSVKGSGRVIAYAPLDRQQEVEAPIDGRVKQWFVQEGDRVAEGDPIAELSDNDPDILARLRREADAAQAQVDAVEVSIAVTEARIASLQTVRESAITNARLRVQMAKDRLVASQNSVEAAEIELHTAELNYKRQEQLHERGLASEREYELSRLKYKTAKASLERAQAGQRAAEAEVQALAADRNKVASSNQASIESTQSAIAKLQVDRAKAQAELAKVEVRLARQARMQVTAPRAGTILKLVAKQETEMVKAGDTLVVLVPESNSSAVELYVDGNDAPLIDAGRRVRVQFEGWPAVQFVGWPSVAVGTFPGKVAFVDAHDDGHGRFRVVIVPESSEEWPDSRYLRQGVRANGWVLLDQVSLGFELWRQFNGFPPTTSAGEEPGKKAGVGK